MSDFYEESAYMQIRNNFIEYAFKLLDKKHIKHFMESKQNQTTYTKTKWREIHEYYICFYCDCGEIYTKAEYEEHNKKFHDSNI